MTTKLGWCLDQRHEDHPFGCPGIVAGGNLICSCSCHGSTDEHR